MMANLETETKKNLLEEMTLVSEDFLFDTLIEKVGKDGKFQRRFNWLFNLVVVALFSMPYLNLVIMMYVPEHHCHVPGRENTNYTLDEWQRRSLPIDVNPKTGVETVSSCQMFNSSEKSEQSVISCQYGWDYDKRWYGETAPTDEDWVCDKGLYVTNTFVANRVGAVLGLLIFGQLGDIIGRKPVFYSAITLLIIGRVATAFTASYYNWFLTSVLFGSMATITVFISPVVICMEVSSEKKRTEFMVIQNIAWVLGCCALPFIGSAVGHWSSFILITTLPSLFIILTYRLMPESPRWLAGSGRISEAYNVLKYIAAVNGTQVPENAESILHRISEKREKLYGVPSLFSNARLAKNTFSILICWSACNLSYHSLVLNVNYMSGSPVMNFFWQFLIELPGAIFGKILTDRFGRRWTQTFTFCAAAILHLAVILSFGSTSWLINTWVTLAKMSITISFYIVFLQAVEIYPTCLRQTGTSLGGLTSNIFGILAPYIVYLGTAIDPKLTYVALMGLAVLGVVFSIQLPETLNRKLPETLEDTINFGKDQKLWSFNRRKN